MAARIADATIAPKRARATRGEARPPIDRFRSDCAVRPCAVPARSMCRSRCYF